MELNPIAQIHWETILSIMAIFLVTLLILRKIFFLPILEILESRTKKIEKAKAKREEVEVLLSEAQAKAEAILLEAREKAEIIADEVKEEIAKLREKKISEANERAEQILAKGREEVIKLKQIEQAELREDLSICTSLALKKLVGSVDEKMVRYVVNKVIAAGR